LKTGIRTLTTTEPTKTFEFNATDLEATDRLGAAIATAFLQERDDHNSGLVIAMIGTLGAGKTRLTQALAVGLGTPNDTVVSPTFVLCQHYHAKASLHHFDTYRLADSDEFLELGPEEYYEDGNLCVIEWADRVDDCLPPEHLRIEVEVLGETSRRFLCKAIGESAIRVLERSREVLS